jgi:hypothetical protein
VLDTVTTAARKMACAAIFAGGTTDALGNLVPIRRIIGFFVALKNGGFGNGVSGTSGKFFIGSGLLMADQAVDLGLVAEIEILVFPSITGMTRCATSLVAFDVNSEVVDGQPAFAEFRVALAGGIKPGPVNGFVELQRGLVMAFQAGLGDFRSGLEFLLQKGMLRVVGRNPKLFGFGGLLGQFASGRQVFLRGCGQRQGRDSQQ